MWSFVPIDVSSLMPLLHSIYFISYIHPFKIFLDSFLGFGRSGIQLTMSISHVIMLAKFQRKSMPILSISDIIIIYNHWISLKLFRENFHPWNSCVQTWTKFKCKISSIWYGTKLMVLENCLVFKTNFVSFLPKYLFYYSKTIVQINYIKLY